MSVNRFEDLFIQVGGYKVRYWQGGDSGSPVVFIHGLGGFIENWENNIHAFSQHHRVYALDLLGCGHTDKPSIPYSIAALAKFVQDFLAAKNVTDVNLIGHSLGARIALELYLTDPDNVRKLVFESGIGFGRKVAPVLRISTMPALGERLMKPNPAGVEEYLKILHHDHSLVTAEAVDFALEQSDLPGASQAYLSTLRASANIMGVKRKVIRETISKADCVHVPTLVIWGREDQMLPVEQAYAAEELLPHATLKIIENCGHMPHVECYQEYNRIVLDFLSAQKCKVSG